MNANDLDLKDDLIVGAEPIGEYCNMSVRRIYYCAEKKLLPIFKVGAILHARKSELQKRLSAEAA